MTRVSARTDMARLLKAAGGIPSHGNDRNAWKAGERFGYRPPEGTIKR
ncbi:MAG: hypothetical protein AAGC58_00660 [Asticcacaulis sp.]